VAQLSKLLSYLWLFFRTVAHLAIRLRIKQSRWSSKFALRLLEFILPNLQNVTVTPAVREVLEKEVAIHNVVGQRKTRSSARGSGTTASGFNSARVSRIDQLASHFFPILSLLELTEWQPWFPSDVRQMVSGT
jgi:hypothetical protein